MRRALELTALRAANERRTATLRTLRRAEGERSEWYEIRNHGDGETADIYIYDQIGGLFGLSAGDFVKELSEIHAEKIVVHLNTPGGDVFDGIAIFTALGDHAADIEVRVDGVAASIGSVIAMAGDRVVMARHSTMMIHEGLALVFGAAEDMRKNADILDRLSDTIAGVYAERAGGEVAEWRERMRAETWYSDQEAVDAGLADEVASTEAPENAFDLSAFKHTPEHLRTATAPAPRPTSKRQAERALRDVGLSHTAAKAVLAGGWEDEHEDVDARDVRALTELSNVIKGANEGMA